MKKIISFIFSLSLLLLFSCSEDEAVLTANISGYVTDYVNANSPIAGATVTISTKGITKTTGSDGRYEFTDIEPGTYTLQVSANGYQTTTKQATLYAGENVNLDFQLSPAGQDVEITPQMLSFGPQTNRLTFSIKNKGNSSMQYSITNYPNYITVSPSTGSISAKGTQTVSVNVNRDLLTTDATCQLLVNIGNDSYPVNISINSEEVSQKISVTPSVLDFGTDYKELQFTIKNVGTAGDLSWNISQPSEACIQVSPTVGTTAVGKSTQVTVKIDRNKMQDDLQSFININVAGGSVSVQVIGNLKSEEGGNTSGNGDIAVKSNLLAYYTFDNENMFDSFENEMHGQLYNNPSFIEDTPNGNGKAISLNSIKEQYANIPYKIFNGRTAYSVNLWIKDFGSGTIFSSTNASSNITGPSLFAQEDGTFNFRVGYYESHSINFSYKYKAIQDGYWHMITLVLRNNKNADLYIDGMKVDTGASYYIETDGINLQFGGTSSLKLDNVRFYAMDLTADEVLDIYNSEK